MNTKSIILIVIALVCGLVASVAVHQVMSSGPGDGSNKVQTVQVVMATDAIDINEQLTEENLALQDWPADRVPEGAVTKMEDALEQFAGTRFYKGEPILGAKIAGSINGGQDIPQGFRVVPIKVQKDSVTDLVRPGDKVDVSCFLRGGRGNSAPQVKTILTAVRIYSVNNRTDRIQSEDDSKGSSAIKSMTVLAKSKHADLLSLAMEIGKLRLLLRSPTDTGNAETEAVADANSLLNAIGERADDPDSDQSVASTDTQDDSFKDWLKGIQEEQVDLPKKPKVEEPLPQQFSMIVHAGDGSRLKYEWNNRDQLPMEITGNARAAAPTSPIAPADSESEVSVSEDDYSESADQPAKEGSTNNETTSNAA